MHSRRQRATWWNLRCNKICTKFSLCYVDEKGKFVRHFIEFMQNFFFLNTSSPPILLRFRLSFKRWISKRTFLRNIGLNDCFFEHLAHSSGG